MPFIPLRWSRYVVPNPFRGRLREWTPRRLAAARRAVKREQGSVPLFPELAKYKTVDDRVKELDQNHLAFALKFRARHAEQWREARRRMKQLNPGTRHALALCWNQGGQPKDPVYLLDLIHDYDVTGYSPWSWLRFHRQLKLTGAGRLARTHLNETFERWSADHCRGQRRRQLGLA